MMILTRGAFALPATTLNYKTGTWRVQRPVHLHGTAPCHGACPAGEDAQAYLARIEEGDLRGAWETLVMANPLPAVTGRVCHHPCEAACNRGRYDEAIAIHNVERFLGDEALRSGWAYPVSRPEPGASRFAVVGAGPAGLSAAYHLIRQGFNVTLFDELPIAGGTLRTALPQYRLPREVLDAEVERILALGIDFQSHRRLGRDVSLEELRQQYRAVFLGPGRQVGREWSVDGVTPRDLHHGLDLLKEWVALGSVAVPRSVAIIGGGNTAVDLSRIMKRAGVAEVHIITHQALPEPGKQVQDAMTAIAREVFQALEEGVEIHANRGIRRLILRGERVVGVEMVRMKKLDRGNGRLERVAFEGTETVLHVDQVIPAIGQSVDAAGMESVLDGAREFAVDTWGVLTATPGVFAGGDARSGSGGTVSGAVGDGRRAALAMARHHIGLANPAAEARPPQVDYKRLNLNYFEHAPRPRELVLPVVDRQGGREIEQGLSHDQVVFESQRCFSCGNCFACDNCWTLCPDSAVLKTKDAASDGSHYMFDYDYCKGCGLCANECPCGFIAMEEDI